MKKIIQYQCEGCGRRFMDEQDALDCEARGEAPNYPIGCVFGNHEKDAFYKDITFAVAQKRQSKKGTFDYHHNDLSLWACRDNGAGDSLGESMCGGAHSTLSEYDGRIDFDAPHFKRMIKWLKEQNIPITVWDGKEAVPYVD